MKILHRNLNRSTFVVWEMKRNVSVVCNILISGKIIKEMPGSAASGTHCIINPFRLQNIYNGEDLINYWPVTVLLMLYSWMVLTVPKRLWEKYSTAMMNNRSIGNFCSRSCSPFVYGSIKDQQYIISTDAVIRPYSIKGLTLRTSQSRVQPSSRVKSICDTFRMYYRIRST